MTLQTLLNFSAGIICPANFNFLYSIFNLPKPNFSILLAVLTQLHLSYAPNVILIKQFKKITSPVHVLTGA